MIKGLTLVEVRALRAFTKTTKHGQFHGDPNGVPAAKLPKVPDYVVDELVASGRIELLDGSAGEAPSPASRAAPAKALTAKTGKPMSPKQKAAFERMQTARKAKAAKPAVTDAPAD